MGVQKATYRSIHRYARSLVYLFFFIFIHLNAHAVQVSQTDTSQAHQLYTDAQSLIKEASYEQANKLLIRAADSFRSQRQWKRTAETYNLLSSNFRILSKLDSSATYARKAIDLLNKEAVAAWDAKAIAYNNLGLVETENSNFQDAIDLFENALDLADREAVTIETRATLLGNIGSVYDEQGDFERALEYYSMGIELLKGDGADNKDYREQLARLYNYIGITYRKKGQPDKALQFYEQELQINIDLYGEGHPSVARVYSNMGGVYYYRDDFGQAAIYFRRAAESTELIFGEMHPRVGLLYNNVGAIYYEQGDYEQAVEYLEKSAEIKRETQGENHPDLALTYNNLGSIYTELEEFEKGREYLQQSLEIRKRVLGNNHPVLSNNFNSLGMLHLNTNEPDSAIDYFSQSLEITLRSRGEAHPYAAEARTNLAKAYRAKGELSEAMQYLASAEEELGIDRSQAGTGMSIPYRHPTSAVDVLHQKGITYYEQYEINGDAEALKSAIDTYTRLSSLLDVIQLSFQNEESKLLMGSQSHLIYEDALNAAFTLYQETGNTTYLEKMFFFSEKSKSRVILELLNTREAKKFADIPDSLVAYENQLRQRLSDLQQSLSSVDMSSEPDASQGSARASLQDSLFTLDRQLSDHLSFLKEQYPKYHAFKFRSDVLSAGEVRSRYFRRDTGTVLEYFYGGEESYAIVITSEDIHAVRLPHLSELPKKITELNRAISQKQDSVYLELAHQMYKALIEPVEPYLEGAHILWSPMAL